MRANPFYGVQIKKLHGKLEGSYRYRAGDKRVIYSIDKKNKTVWIEAIGKHEIYWKERKRTKIDKKN